MDTAEERGRSATENAKSTKKTPEFFVLFAFSVAMNPCSSVSSVVKKSFQILRHLSEPRFCRCNGKRTFPATTRRRVCYNGMSTTFESITSMAKLRITSPELKPVEFELGPGRSVVGREGQLDCVIPHSSVSRQHCELVLTEEALTVRDLGSRNGTFLNGERIQTAHVQSGSTLRVGDVDLIVAEAPAHISVPDIPLAPLPPPATFMEDGSPCCARHPGVEATLQCTACQGVFCTGCVRKLCVAGGIPRMFCPDCGNTCQPIVPKPKAAKRGWLGRIVDVFTK